MIHFIEEGGPRHIGLNIYWSLPVGYSLKRQNSIMIKSFDLLGFKSLWIAFVWVWLSPKLELEIYYFRVILKDYWQWKLDMFTGKNKLRYVE